MLLDLLETYVSEEETIRIIAEQIINGESDEELLKQYPNELVERAHLYALSLYYKTHSFIKIGKKIKNLLPFIYL